TVVVTDPATGCQTINSMAVPDLTSTPVVTASAVDIICSNATSGSVSAHVGGVTSGYTFHWYRGNVVKPTPDYTGSTVDNLTAGKYTEVATACASACSSAPVTVTVDQSVKPVITATTLTDMTSCDAALPNGSATVNVTSGGGNYTFEWFRGQNTIA